VRAQLLERQAPIEEEPLRSVDLPTPQPRPGEILIRVRACGVCHTDLHVVEGDLRPHKLSLVPGHQIVGEVAGHGPGASAVMPPIGTRVGVPWLSSTCGRCRFCRSDRENLCEAARFTGYDVDGGFAEYVVAPGDSAYPLPENMSDAEVAPLLCGGVIGYRALRLSEARPGDVLGLYGFGASAHITLQLARGRGIDCFVFTRSVEHQALARQLGAAWAGRATDTPPSMLAAAIIFAPAGNLVPEALRVLDKGGTCALAGISMTPIPSLDYHEFLYGERTLRSVANLTHADVRELLEAVHRTRVTATVETFPLDAANHVLRLLKESKLRASGVLMI
jgi:alcohol dehydrogenase, propanol-preferring